MINRYPFLLLGIILLVMGCQSVPMVPSDWQSGDSDLLQAALQFYRGPLNHLRAVRYGRCPMYPSCSVYGRQSIQKHGPLIGWMMTCDRLMRCGRDELQIDSRIYDYGFWKFVDPVDNNDFWWYAPLPATEIQAEP